MSALGPGTKVKCIYPGPWKRYYGEPGAIGPPEGTVWTIKEVQEYHYLTYRDTGEIVVAILLVEWPTNNWFDVKCFRPVDQIDELLELCQEYKVPGVNPVLAPSGKNEGWYE